jgi:hypothetical protein
MWQGESMLALARLVGASLILVSLLVGGRLLLLGLRSRRAPELAVGLGLFTMGGVGWPLLVVAQQVGGWKTALGQALLLPPPF